MSVVNRRWAVHGVVLLVLLGVYFWLMRKGLLAKPQGSVDFSGIAIVFGMVAYLLYALVTTLLMIGACRIRGGPFILHGIGMLAWILSITYKQADREAREARYQQDNASEIRSLKEQQAIERCLILDELTIHRKAPMRIELRFTSRDCPKLMVHGLSAGAFRANSNRLFSEPLRAAERPIEEGASPTFSIPSVLSTDDLGTENDWAFNASISITAPQSMSIAYCTPGAPRERWLPCRPIGKVTISDR